MAVSISSNYTVILKTYLLLDCAYPVLNIKWRITFVYTITLLQWLSIYGLTLWGLFDFYRQVMEERTSNIYHEHNRLYYKKWYSEKYLTDVHHKHVMESNSFEQGHPQTAVSMRTVLFLSWWWWSCFWMTVLWVSARCCCFKTKCLHLQGWIDWVEDMVKLYMYPVNTVYYHTSPSAKSKISITNLSFWYS